MTDKRSTGQIQPQAFGSGTIMLFQQTTAPTGWTKETTHNNKGLRLQTGTVTTGGSDNFTTTFSSSKATDSHTLTTTESAAHIHTVNKDDSGAGSSTQARAGAADEGTFNSGSSGGGGGHVHTVTLDLEFVDVILAKKD